MFAVSFTENVGVDIDEDLENVPDVCLIEETVWIVVANIVAVVAITGVPTKAVIVLKKTSTTSLRFLESSPLAMYHEFTDIPDKDCTSLVKLLR